MTSVSDPEISAFLSEGTRTGILGYVSASGRPLVTPVWFIVEDGTLVFNTGKGTAKGRSLARDARATLCANLQEPPYGFVQVQRDGDRGPLHGGRQGRGGRQAQRRAGRAGRPAGPDEGRRRAQRHRLTGWG